MSLNLRRELLLSVKHKYSNSNWQNKSKILDGFIAATGYERKYAIQLLNNPISQTNNKRRRSSQYGEQVQQALTFIWKTANKICSKRLVPFIPQLIEAMERNGHLRLPDDVRQKLLTISPATVDRLLQQERKKGGYGLSTTKAGNLLKNKIQIRTFADWDDVTPGFLEIDLVAHCGGNTNGSFLNTLTLIDISTGWLECMPILRKSASDVIDGLAVSDGLFPFGIKGIDTDCGSEFINYELLDYCEDNQITFTRARTHRKNDQAHVEEKNGSVIRRLVGYDRFEGQKSWEALARLYNILRKYVNFFQPSLKLLSKERLGSKVSKKYDKAKTPYQRVLQSKHISKQKKNSLTEEYNRLDPVSLLAQLNALQDDLWKFAGDKNGNNIDGLKVSEEYIENKNKKDNMSNNRYYHTKTKVDFRKSPRTWRTRKDPFETVWDEIRLRLELRPEITAKQIIDWLMSKYSDKYSLRQTRTLQRRIAQWRLEQESQEEKLRTLIYNDNK